MLAKENSTLKRFLSPLNLVLLLIIASLQYRLWHNEGEFAKFEKRQQYLSQLEQDNRKVKQQNQALYAQILDLREGLDAIEEKARQELGMIKKGETFYRIVPADDEDK